MPPSQGVCGRPRSPSAVKRRNPNPIVAIRLIVGGQATEDIVPAVPRLVGELARCPGLVRNGAELVALRCTSSAGEPDDLFDLLDRPERQLPVVALSRDESAALAPQGDLAPRALGRALIGLAHVVEIDAETSWRLTDRYGQKLSVFGGALRVYRAGFDHFADPYDHPLYLPFRFAGAEKSAGLARHLREEAAAASLRRWRLGRDVISFHAVRDARLKLLLDRQHADETRSDADLLATAEERLREVERRLKDVEQDRDLALDEQLAAEERADTAERQLLSYRARIEILEARRPGPAEEVASSPAEPDAWEDFAEWVEVELAGRLTLTPAARRSVKKPLYESPAIAARCLRRLAAEVCDAFRGEGGGSRLDGLRLDDAIQNARCGGDAFHFSHQGRKLVADWHVKNGGNTRDPGRCLRIYYAYDEQTREIVVADMPAHRRTAAT